MLKRNLFVSGYKHENIWEGIGQTKIWESAKQILWSVEIDQSLSFDKYVSSFYKKARKIVCISIIVQFYEFNSKTSINENIYRISVRILSFGLDVPC